MQLQKKKSNSIGGMLRSWGGLASSTKERCHHQWEDEKPEACSVMEKCVTGLHKKVFKTLGRRQKTETDLVGLGSQVPREEKTLRQLCKEFQVVQTTSDALALKYYNGIHCHRIMIHREPLTRSLW